MAFQINRLLHLRDFDVEVGRLGFVHVSTLTNSQLATLTKAARSDESNAESLARQLLGLAASRVPTATEKSPGQDAPPPVGVAVQAEELSSLTGAELDEFCLAFLSKNNHLVEGQDGRRLDCAEHERGSDFLKRALRNHAAVEAAAVKRVTDTISGYGTLQEVLKTMSASGLMDKLASAATMEADLRRQVLATSSGSLQQLHADLDLITSGKLASGYLAKQTSMEQEIARITQYVSIDQINAFNDWQRMASNAEQHQRLVDDTRRAAEAISKLAMPQTVLSLEHSVQQRYEHLFRLPAIGEAERLAVEAIVAGSSAASVFGAADRASLLQTRMKAMTVPWLNTERLLATATGFAELQAIGYLANHADSLSEPIAALLRQDLGDWRDFAPFEPESFNDPFARSGMYLERGFNPRLTDFSVTAFESSLTIAGLREPDEKEAEVDDETLDEDGLARNRSAFDQLQRFEIAIRQFITDVMLAEFGTNWMKQQIPGDMLLSWRTKKEAAVKAGYAEQPLIDYADFSDYKVIIERKDNWERAFKSQFGRPEDVRESFQRLYPVRIATMHARVITLDDEFLLRVEVTRIMRVVRKHRSGGGL